MTRKEIPSSEPGCDQKMQYGGRDPIPALSKIASKKKKVIYLTYPKGHFNPYPVED